jgi:TonB-linked SusC/RagA family outer membrane protein
MKKILLLGCCLVVVWCGHAQQRTVTGKVTDEADGAGLPGVSVIIKGTTTGTATDADGNYGIQAATGDVLSFSFIGFELQDVSVGAQTTIDVVLKGSISQLQEVVVIGYGEREKRDLTGAISSMESDDIAKSTYMTPEMAMQGRLAGVFVGTPSGNPFDRPTVQIRGVATFGYANPLYVIDGIPILEGGQSSTFPGDVDVRSPVNVMSMINPNDIESISVLKDASSAAIYGVRASNGVILITTKKGKSGAPKVEFNAQRGVQNLVNTYDMLNTEQYTSLYQQAYANNPTEAANLPAVFIPGDPAYLGNGPTYDWQKDLINKNAVVEDYGIRVSGGSQTSQYYVSAGYGRTEGTLVENSLERYSIASNVTSNVNKYIETGLDLKFTYIEANDNTGTDLPYVATAPPWQPIFDSNDVTGFAPSVVADFMPNPDFDPSLLNPGPAQIFDGEPSFLWGPATRGNVFAGQALGERNFSVIRTLGSAYLQIEPIKGLKIKGSLSADYYFNLRKQWNNYDSWRFSQTPGNPYSGHDGTAKGSYGERQSRNFNLIKELTINYNKSIGDHNFDLTLNAMDQEQTWTYTDASSGQINSVDPALRGVPNRPPYVAAFTGRRPQTLQGYFARLGYKYQNKYYVDATVRRDGASVFAPGFRWGTFTSFSGGWRISAEPFFQNLGITQINDLKFRGGWGELGNKETTQGFAYLSTISTTPDYALGSGAGNGYGTQVMGASLPNYPNYDLSWERVSTTNVGFDATLFNNHITLTAEYYNRYTKGIIQAVSLPPNAGIQSPADLNIGNVRNSGIELQLGYNTMIGELALNVGGNLTTVKNRVENLYQGTPFGGEINSDGQNGRVQVGYPINYIWGYQVGGVFQNDQEIADWQSVYDDGFGTNNPVPGDMWFHDINGIPAAGQILNPVPDSLINPNDRTYLGKSIAGFYYGFNLGLQYKGFDLSLFFQGVGDIQKYNHARAGGEAMSSTGANQWTSTMGRWTPENPSTTMPRAVRNDPNVNNRFSSRFVEDSDFLRLKNAQVGYTIPASLLAKTGAIDRVRVYVSATNLFTITGWKGIDPENDFNPPTRQLLFGLNATF